MVRIVRADPLPDGRWNILVQGMALININDSLDGKLYRQAHITLRTFQDEKGLSPEQRETLQNLFIDYVIQSDSEEQTKSSQIESYGIIEFYFPVRFKGKECFSYRIQVMICLHC